MARLFQANLKFSTNFTHLVIIKALVVFKVLVDNTSSDVTVKEKNCKGSFSLQQTSNNKSSFSFFESKWQYSFCIHKFANNLSS